jgi:uncharacterized cupin superfamily protein
MNIKEGDYTGYNDVNGEPIYVGDTIREGCNGLVSTVIWNQEAGTFTLNGLSDEYCIADAAIEWTKISGK